MTYHLILKPSAEKQLERLPAALQRRIIQKLAQIEAEPRMPGSGETCRRTKLLS